MKAIWFALIATLAGAGCQTGGGNKRAGEHYMVNAQRTQFYKYGPAQSTGPDFALYKGQGLTMVDYEFGYSQVRTDDGQSGYVSSDDIVPSAAPSPTPKPNLPAAQKDRRATGEEEQKLLPLPPLPGEQPSEPPALHY